MAIYHASTKPIARSAGRSAVAAAAYRAGVDLVDARTGLVHDYTRKGGVELTEILTPDGIGVERNALWDAAELAEKRKDARTAREWIVALPSELNAEQRTALTRDFAQCLVERYGVAVDFAIHAPDREGDHRNHHAHILTTTRQVSRAADGGLTLGAKAHIELSDKARKERGLGASADEVKAVRELWERTANAALEQAGVDARIDARSLREQDIDRVPQIHAGPAVTVIARMKVRETLSELHYLPSVGSAPMPEAVRRLGVVQAAVVSNAAGAPLRVAAQMAVIVDLNALRQEREIEQARERERKAERERRDDVQARWTERQQGRATRQEREARRERLVMLADALGQDRACELDVRRAYLDAGYQRQQRGDRWFFVYPHGDLPEDVKTVTEAWRSRNRRKQGLEQDRAARQERKVAARREFEQSHGGQPDRLAITRAVAALVATQAQRARQATQDRWTERQRQRATRQEREVRRRSLVDLAEALAKDQACSLHIRQAYLDAGYRLEPKDGKRIFVYSHDDMQAERQNVSGSRRSWDQRKQGLDRDRAAEQETRPGIRHPDKPRWQVERERILTRAYDLGVADKMGRWYDIQRGPDSLTLSNRAATITDHGDRITAKEGNEREIEAMVVLTKAKDWKRVSLTGSLEFQERAARAFVEAGIGLTDERLEKVARDAIEAAHSERERQAERRAQAQAQAQAHQIDTPAPDIDIEDLEAAMQRLMHPSKPETKRRTRQNPASKQPEPTAPAPVVEPTPKALEPPMAPVVSAPQYAPAQPSPNKAPAPVVEPRSTPKIQAQQTPAKPTPTPAPQRLTPQQQVDAFFAQIDREANGIRDEAVARLPDVEKRHDALQMAFYATCEWPKSPVSRGFLGIKRTDPNWKDPEAEGERLTREMRSLELSSLRDLARGQWDSRREAERRAEARDPEGYKRIMGMHDELQRQKTQQAIDRGREIRREKAKTQGKGVAE